MELCLWFQLRKLTMDIKDLFHANKEKYLEGAF